MSGKPAASVRARLRAEAERSLTAEEVRAYLDTPIEASEREDILALVRWFRRRYPDPADRLAYIRTAYERWRRVSSG
jgi:site-specific recombinase